MRAVPLEGEKDAIGSCWEKCSSDQQGNLAVKCGTLGGPRLACEGRPDTRPRVVLDVASFAYQVRVLAQGSERLLATQALLGLQ